MNYGADASDAALIFEFWSSAKRSPVAGDRLNTNKE
jgi:hypothetical protein